MLWNVRKRCNNCLYLSCQSFQSPDDDMNTTRKRSCWILLSELEKLEEFPQLIWHFHVESGPFLMIWDFWWLCLFWLGILLWKRIKSKIWPSHTFYPFWIFVQYFSGTLRLYYLRLLLSSPDPSTKCPWSSWSGPYFPPLLTHPSLTMFPVRNSGSLTLSL